MERTNSWELFGRLRSTLHAAPLGVQRWRWWLWEFKKLESECDAKLLVFCVFSYFSTNICQKLTVPGNQGLKKISIFIIQLSYLPSKYVHFSMEKNHTNLQYVSMATKKNHQWKPSLLRHGSAPRNFWFRAHDRFVQVADPKKWTFKKRDEFWRYLIWMVPLLGLKMAQHFQST